MSQALHPMLNVAVKAAREAARIISRASFDLDALKVGTKAPNDFVTEVDQAAEEAIIATLLAAYPGHAILAEESGRAHGAKDSEYLWIIDPLDGTTNFIHGFPAYAVSIALAFRGQVQQAVVYDPTRNDLYFASKGRGAFLNDKRLRVSRRLRMAEALIGTGFPFRRGDDFKKYLAMFELLMPKCAGLRRPGSAALDLCHVAAGHYDGFFESGLQPWDVAAGSLMITEAGGLVGNFTGDADYLDRRELVAGNPKIYAQLVSLLAPFTSVRREPAPAPTATAGGSQAASVAEIETPAAALERTFDAAEPLPPAEEAGETDATPAPAPQCAFAGAICRRRTTRRHGAMPRPPGVTACRPSVARRVDAVEQALNWSWP